MRAISAEALLSKPLSPEAQARAMYSVLKTGRGLLFDLETLSEIGKEVMYTGKPTHIPPEAVAFRDRLGRVVMPSEAIIEDQHLVFELGQSLRELWEDPWKTLYPGRRDTLYFQPIQASGLDQLQSFVKRMISPRSSERPNLEETLAHLEQFCDPYLASIEAELLIERPQPKPRSIEKTRYTLPGAAQLDDPSLETFRGYPPAPQANIHTETLSGYPSATQKSAYPTTLPSHKIESEE